jgi:hypothetical protein
VATDLRDHTADLEDGADIVNSISSFGEDTNGELYLLVHSNTAAVGKVWRIVPGP